MHQSWHVQRRTLFFVVLVSQSSGYQSSQMASTPISGIKSLFVVVVFNWNLLRCRLLSSYTKWLLSWISTIYFEYGLHIQLVDQHCFLLGMGFTQIIQELPEANLYQLFTSPLPLSVWITHLRSQRDFFPWEGLFFFLCCFREGGETGQSAGHLLALPVPWPYGILGMYYSSLHSYNLPGFRLRQDRRANDYPRENTHKNSKYLTQTDPKTASFYRWKLKK